MKKVQIEALQAERDQYKRDAELHQKQRDALKAQLAELQAQLESLGEDVGQLRSDLEDAEKERDELQANLVSANADKEAYAQNAIDLRKRVDSLRESLTELNGIERKRYAAIAQLTELQATIERQSAEIAGMDRKSDLSHDTGYRNGVMHGYKLAVEGSEEEYQKCVNRLTSDINSERREIKLSVVFPDRRWGDSFSNGWNACLDSTAALNGEKPFVVAVDPGQPGSDMTCKLTGSVENGKLTVHSLEHSKPAACDLPPLGWTCSRVKGHDGPCAASLTYPAVPEDRQGAIWQPTITLSLAEARKLWPSTPCPECGQPGCNGECFGNDMMGSSS